MKNVSFPLALFILLGCGTAIAAPGGVYYAGSCGSPSYGSIQAAVDAAPAGSTVIVCGAHTESVILTKSLNLSGGPGAAISATSLPLDASKLPPAFQTDALFVPKAIVTVWGAGVNVAITNLTITGPFVAASCAEDIFGVLVLGGSVALTGDQVQQVRPADPGLNGCQFGVGVQVGRKYWPTAGFGGYQVEDFAGTATIMNTSVSGYSKNGITIDGPGSSASVRGNTITGDGRVPYTAENGTQISRGAGGDVRGNAVSGHAYTGGTPYSSAGILLFGGCGDELVTGVQVMQNVLTNNDVGVYLNNYNAACDGPSLTMTNNKATNNSITNNAVSNICTLGYAGCLGYVVYQVGVDVIGDNDKAINNDISGIGYVNPANNPAAGIYLLPVDTISFPTTASKVHANGSK